MWQCSTEPRTRRNVKKYRFLSFSRKYRKQLLDTDSLKHASKKAVHQSFEFLGNTIVGKIIKSNDDKIMKRDENSRKVEKLIIPPKKRKKY